jgi:hypothetical protein
MPNEVRCLLTNEILKPGQWYWYSWEMEAPISASGMADIEILMMNLQKFYGKNGSGLKK